MSSIKKLREKLDLGEITAVELAKKYLNKIKLEDIKINAVITLCEKEASGG